MIVNEYTKLEGFVTGIGKIKIDGTEEFEWLDKPKHNRIVSVGLDHLMCYDGNVSGYYTSNSNTPAEPSLWIGNLNNHYGVLSFCKIGTGTKETEFTDTDLQTPIGGLSNAIKTGEPFCGTKCTSEGDFILRVSHISNIVNEVCKINEVGLFGQYGEGDNKVNPMFARIKLDKGISLNAGERLIFTYDLHIIYADIEPVEDESFFELLDSVGEPLKYSRKIYFKYEHLLDTKYGDSLLRDLYISRNGTEEGYNSNNNNRYFVRLPVYYYNLQASYGDYDTLGYSLTTQSFNVQDASLSKARAEAKADNYTYNVLDYTGVGNKNKYRDVTICMGLFNPNMEETSDYSDIKFLRFRGMNYRFGYYTINPETEIKTWNEQSLRKWSNQTMTFTIRTRYVTEDTYDLNGNDPDMEV